nr:expressed protein [Hymenolepis microstoma]
MTNDRHKRLRKQDLSKVNKSTSLDKFEDFDDVYGLHQDSGANWPKRSCRRSSLSGLNFPSNAQPRNHAEVERYRRRNLAIMYELIGLCITEKDLNKYCRSELRNSLEDLSYHEILRIACEKFKVAIGDIIRIKHVMRNIRELEELQRRLNMPSRIKRPAAISCNFHRKLREMVENMVRTDAR